MKIEFIPSSKEVELTVPMPEPAKNFIPDWYKSKPRFLESGKPDIIDGKVINNSIKGCVPFYDAMAFGYIQKTWCDININFNDKEFNYSYSRSPSIISHRKLSIEISDCFYPVEFLWIVPWIAKLPDGWSILMVSPLNRDNSITHNTSGIIDCDSFYHSFPATYPFYIKNNFNGIIPAGTPMYQMIPIKRENWQSSPLLFSDDERYKLGSMTNSYFIGAYKRFFHKKKIFK